MRVIRSLLGSLLLIAILLGGSFLLGREVWLSVALNPLRNDLQQLKRMEANPTEYFFACREKGGLAEEAIPERFQLRFSTPTEYQLEVVCRQFPTDPLVIESRSLPYPQWFRKLPGSSGVVFGSERSLLGFSLLGRQAALGFNDKQVVRERVSTNMGISPLSSCSAYGYTCCQLETSLGEGPVFDRVTDCPRSCYQGCQSRPILLSFQSRPAPDTNRTVSIPPGEVIQFSYVVDPGAEDLAAVTIDYGDGSSETFTESLAGSTHQFSCSRLPCQYQVSLTALDSAGAETAETAVSQITVLVE